MDGCEVARQVRNDPSMSNVLLIALTGYGQAHDGVLIRNVGFDDHLIKPISPTDVSSYIASRFPQNGVSSPDHDDRASGNPRLV
jgi:CheY-like chemotaxis protein